MYSYFAEPRQFLTIKSISALRVHGHEQQFIMQLINYRWTCNAINTTVVLLMLYSRDLQQEVRDSTAVIFVQKIVLYTIYDSVLR